MMDGDVAPRDWKRCKLLYADRTTIDGHRARSRPREPNRARDRARQGATLREGCCDWERERGEDARRDAGGRLGNGVCNAYAMGA